MRKKFPKGMVKVCLEGESLTVSNMLTFKELFRKSRRRLDSDYVWIQSVNPVHACDKLRYHFSPEVDKVGYIEGISTQAPNNMSFALALSRNQVKFKSATVRIPSQRRSVEIARTRIRQFLPAKEKKGLLLEWDFQRMYRIKRGPMERTEDGVYEDEDFPDSVPVVEEKSEETKKLVHGAETPEAAQVLSPNREAETPERVQNIGSEP
jgi:hypothetical protein